MRERPRDGRRTGTCLVALACLVSVTAVGVQCGGSPRVVIETPAHGAITDAVSVSVSGRVAGIAPSAASLSVNGVPVAIGADHKWSTEVSLQSPVNPILAEVTHVAGGRVFRDRIVVLRGDAVPDGEASPRSLAIRITDDALDVVEPLIADTVDVDPDTLFPPGTLIWEVPVLGNDVRILGSSFGALSADIDAMTGFAGIDVEILDVRVDVNVEVSVFPDCQATVEADSVRIEGQYTLSPDAGDPTAIDVAQQGDVFVFVAGLDPSTNCGGALGDALIDLFAGVIEERVIDELDALLNTPAGGDTLIAGTFQAALAGLDLSGLISAFGTELGVVLSAPLDEITGDPEGAVIVANAQITSDVGSGPGQCGFVPGAPDLDESLGLPVPAPSFGPASPGGLPYSVALALAPSALNQLLKAQVECGLLVTSVREISLGGGTAPITAALLGFFLDPAFQSFPPGTPFRIDVRPTLAPVVTGEAGPGGELTTLEVPQLQVEVVQDDGSENLALSAAVDLSLGLDLDLGSAGDTLRFVLGPLSEERVRVVLLENRIGASASTVETRFAQVLGDPNLGGRLLADVSAGLSSFPLPSLLGLELAPVEVASLGGAVAVFAHLLPAGTSLARLAPTDDTTVRGGANATSTTGGGAETLEVNGADGGGGGDGDASAKIYLRFDIAPLTSEVGAALALLSPPSGPPASGLTLDVFGLEAPGDDTWPETSLHWDNADDNGHGNEKHRAIDLDADEVYGRGPICTASFVGDAFVCGSASLEGYIAQEMGENGGDDVVTFILAARNLGDGPSVFASKEAGAALQPTLQGVAPFIVPTDDTTVRGGVNSTSTAGGHAPILEVNGADGGSGADGDDSAKIYLRFDVAALTDETGATLKLTAGGTGPSGLTLDVFGLEAPGDDTWPEGSLHWENADTGGHGNNRDRAIDLDPGEVYGRSPLCTAVVDSTEFACHSAALEGYVAQEMAENGGDDLVTFILTARNVGDGASLFVSKEGGSPPRIESAGAP